MGALGGAAESAANGKPRVEGSAQLDAPGPAGGGGKQAQPEPGARRRFTQAPTTMPTNPWPKAEAGPAPGRPARPPTARRGGATLVQLSHSDEFLAPSRTRKGEVK